MVFAKGVLVGGADNLVRLLESGEVKPAPARKSASA